MAGALVHDSELTDSGSNKAASGTTCRPTTGPALDDYLELAGPGEAKQSVDPAGRAGRWGAAPSWR